MNKRTYSAALKGLFLASIVISFPTFSAMLTINPESITRYNYYPNYPNLNRSFLNNALVGDAYRHVMVFDLHGIDGEIVGASLQIEEGLGTHVSVGSSRTYSVWDVTSPINTLAQVNLGTDAANIFADIGSGSLYGTSTFTVQPTNGANPLPSPGVSLDLLGGLLDLNAARGGMIAMGGASPETFYMFLGSVNLGAIRLTLDVEPAVVPSPSTSWLLASGLVLLGYFAERKAKGRRDFRFSGFHPDT